MDNSNNSNSSNSSSSNSYKRNKNGYNTNGYNGGINKYRKNNNVNNNLNDNSIAEKVEKGRQTIRKETAREAIRTGLNAYAPGLGEVADKALKTEKGEKLLDEYAKADNDAEGIKNVAKKLQDESKKKYIMWFFLSNFGLIFFILIILLLVLKNADTQIYSNQNNGQIDTEQYPDDDMINPNVFVKYPGIYEKVEAASEKVSDEYGVYIDKYLILATLVAPIENGNIMPVYDNSCGSDECYYLNGTSYKWDDFLGAWGDQAEYLAKSQILTYVNPASNINVNCGSEETMEQYAKNDLEVNNFSFWGLFNPANWFKGFRNATEAELNAKCIKDLPSGKTKVPTLYVLSIEQGDYYNSVNADHEHIYVKDPESGGVYFWNLVNNGGFIHVYMKDYLNINEENTSDQNYEENLSTILDIADYIYSYYQSIRKDCNNYRLIESTIEKIKVKHKNDDGYDLVDFEDQYVGGVLMAEYDFGDLPSLMAMAILARTEAVAIVGLDGEGVILNSSDHQNYNGSAYNPTYDPSYENQEDNPNYDPLWPKEHRPLIYEAVQLTKGMVISDYGVDEVKHTEYDAFCPVKNTLENGFYYLPDGQNNLPINPDAYSAKSGKTLNIPEIYLECPCFQNHSSVPGDPYTGDFGIRFSLSATEAPTYSGGNPPQETLASCWSRERRGQQAPTRVNDSGQTEYGWLYKPSGGHGRGASQYGLKYFEVFGYDWESLLKLFFEKMGIMRLSSSLEDGECENAIMIPMEEE